MKCTLASVFCDVNVLLVSAHRLKEKPCYPSSFLHSSSFLSQQQDSPCQAYCSLLLNDKDPPGKETCGYAIHQKLPPFSLRPTSLLITLYFLSPSNASLHSLLHVPLPFTSKPTYNRHSFTAWNAPFIYTNATQRNPTQRETPYSSGGGVSLRTKIHSLHSYFS